GSFQLVLIAPILIDIAEACPTGTVKSLLDIVEPDHGLTKECKDPKTSVFVAIGTRLPPLLRDDAN
ncbi:MAG: hypothetical protein M3Y27_06785, partial [Acidobacteriota bacterium]|nr:hypothetical protein [Acidobacteriota bacterium]